MRQIGWRHILEVHPLATIERQYRSPTYLKLLPTQYTRRTGNLFSEPLMDKVGVGTLGTAYVRLSFFMVPNVLVDPATTRRT